MSIHRTTSVPRQGGCCCHDRKAARNQYLTVPDSSIRGNLHAILLRARQAWRLPLRSMLDRPVRQRLKLSTSRHGLQHSAVYKAQCHLLHEEAHSSQYLFYKSPLSLIVSKSFTSLPSFHRSWRIDSAGPLSLYILPKTF
jgi:hypothetical protein